MARRRNSGVGYLLALGGVAAVVLITALQDNKKAQDVKEKHRAM